MVYRKCSLGQFTNKMQWISTEIGYETETLYNQTNHFAEMNIVFIHTSRSYREILIYSHS